MYRNNVQTSLSLNSSINNDPKNIEQEKSLNVVDLTIDNREEQNTTLISGFHTYQNSSRVIIITGASNIHVKEALKK